MFSKFAVCHPLNYYNIIQLKYAAMIHFEITVSKGAPRSGAPLLTRKCINFILPTHQCRYWPALKQIKLT